MVRSGGTPLAPGRALPTPTPKPKADSTAATAATTNVESSDNAPTSDAADSSAFDGLLDELDMSEFDL